MLREEVVHSLKAGKTPEVENIPSKLLKNGGKAATKVLTVIYQKEWLEEWTQWLIIPLPKKGILKQHQKYCTISLISHSSEICSELSSTD